MCNRHEHIIIWYCQRTLLCHWYLTDCLKPVFRQQQKRASTTNCNVRSDSAKDSGVQQANRNRQKHAQVFKLRSMAHSLRLFRIKMTYATIARWQRYRPWNSAPTSYTLVAKMADGITCADPCVYAVTVCLQSSSSVGRASPAIAIFLHLLNPSSQPLRYNSYLELTVKIRAHKRGEIHSRVHGNACKRA